MDIYKKKCYSMFKLKTNKKVPEWTQVEHLFKFEYKDERVKAQILYERIRNIMSHETFYDKYSLIERGEIELYLLVPYGCVFQNDSYFLQYAFSLIYGFVYVREKNKEYKFFGSPTTLYNIIDEFCTCNNDLDDNTHYAYISEILELFRLFINSGMVEYFQDILCIRIGFNCNSCKITFDEDSYQSIEESNPEYTFSNDMAFIYCPFCGNPIFLNHDVKEMLYSFKVNDLQKNFFHKDVFNENFKLQYFSHIHSRNPDCEQLKNGHYELLNNKTYIDIFGISKEEFLSVWNLFAGSIFEEMNRYFYFNYNPDHQVFYTYLIENAVRLIREKKLKQLFNES